MRAINSEPVKGRFYIVRAHDAKGRSEGATIVKFKNREGRGCQLHGDRMGYHYYFEKMDGGITQVWVDFDESEKDFNKVLDQLNENIRPYDSVYNPWDFSLLPIREKAA